MLFSITKKKVVFDISLLTFPMPIPDKGKQLCLTFIFTLLCGASRGFMKALKVFLKTFWGSTKKCENKKLKQLSGMPVARRVMLL